jgi:formylmethanofuran dehydrogenase subunit B
MSAAWTCPFCALSCDHLGVRVGTGAEPLALDGGGCVRAQAALAAFPSQPQPAQALVDGEDCSLDEAIAAAAQCLAASRQPLFAGLATDVAGARALYPLACATGAICDGDAALMPVLRTLQDRGQFTATLAEVRTRAELIVFVAARRLAAGRGRAGGLGRAAGERGVAAASR